MHLNKSFSINCRWNVTIVLASENLEDQLLQGYVKSYSVKTAHFFHRFTGRRLSAGIWFHLLGSQKFHELRPARLTKKIFITSHLDEEEILLQHGAGASKPGRDRAQRSDVSSRSGDSSTPRYIGQPVSAQLPSQFHVDWGEEDAGSSPSPPWKTSPFSMKTCTLHQASKIEHSRGVNLKENIKIFLWVTYIRSLSL